MHKPLCPVFFLGAGGPGGFTGFFEQLQGRAGWRLLLIKGGPGCGKSTLLKKMGSTLSSRGHGVEYIRCSSDPESLDGIICPELRLAAVDATAPHVLEPQVPGALEEVLSLYAFADTGALRPRQRELLALFEEYKTLQARVGRYFSAAGLLLGDTARLAAPWFDLAAADEYGRTLGRRLPKRDGTPGEEIRLLSAVTPRGPVFFRETVEMLAQNVCVLEDDYGAAAPVVLGALRAAALEKGYTVYSCRCPMAPREKLEHILIPDAGFAAVTSNRWHPLRFPGRRVVHCTRFADKKALAERRERFRFNAKASAAFFDEAVALQAQAKAVHDKLEAIYSDAMDFGAVSAYAGEVLATLLDGADGKAGAP